MLPLLADGDEVLADRFVDWQIGDVVVARHPFIATTHLVKHVQAFDAEGRAKLVGCNPAESTDSRSFGNVPADLWVGRVRSRLPTS